MILILNESKQPTSATAGEGSRILKSGSRSVMVLPDESVVNSFCSTAAISCRGMDESLMLFWEEGEGRGEDTR